MDINTITSQEGLMRLENVMERFIGKQEDHVRTPEKEQEMFDSIFEAYLSGLNRRERRKLLKTGVKFKEQYYKAVFKKEE